MTVEILTNLLSSIHNHQIPHLNILFIIIIYLKILILNLKHLTFSPVLTLPIKYIRIHFIFDIKFLINRPHFTMILHFNLHLEPELLLILDLMQIMSHIIITHHLISGMIFAGTFQSIDLFDSSLTATKTIHPFFIHTDRL